MTSIALRSGIKSGKRWLYWTHRWLGILGCLLFLLWFESGIVMMYVPYPSLKPAERRAGLGAINWSRVRLSPDAALAAAGQTAFPGDMRLDTASGEPAWRIHDADGVRIAVSAIDGHRIEVRDAASAAAVARRFAGGTRVREIARIHDDQWTVARGFNWARPLWKVALADPAGTELYVSSTTAEVVQNTTRTERMWKWAGAVPHWLYLTTIRRDGAMWRQVVMWTSGSATIAAISGIWIGILRLRLQRRYKSGSISPYRSGWMKWHHLVGLIGGLTAVTWMASGWLSVNPFDLLARGAPSGGDRLYAAHSGADFPALDYARLSRLHPDAREATLSWVGGAPLVTLYGPGGDPAAFMPSGIPVRFSRERLVAMARLLQPQTAIRGAVMLTQPDLYWYSHSCERPLPVLRVIFADQEETWATIDPRTGALLGQQRKSGRTYRWLFNAIHDFDLPFLLAHRIVRDPVMWLLSAFGIVMSLSGVVISWRHLRHRVARASVKRTRVA